MRMRNIQMLGETKNMNPIKISALASLIGVSLGIQQIDDALKSANSFIFQDTSAAIVHLHADSSPICANGFPRVSEEVDGLEFKIFHANVRAYGYKFITLFILAFDYDQAERLVTKFHSVANSQIMKERPESGGAKKHLFEDDISPEKVVEIAANSEVVYTLFLGDV